MREEWNVTPWCLPSWLLLPIAKILKTIGIFKQRHYLKVVGLFKRTWFDSSNTERALGISFKKKEIAVLGAGTYGSYTSDLLARVYPHENITLIDVGDSHLKTESEIGYISRVVNAPYEGLQKHASLVMEGLLLNGVVNCLPLQKMILPIQQSS